MEGRWIGGLRDGKRKGGRRRGDGREKTEKRGIRGQVDRELGVG